MKKDFLIRDIAIAEGNTQYDQHAKRILSDKRILAYIFKYALKEVRDYSVDELIPMIEGEPQISSVPVDPGESNYRIFGKNTEDQVPYEGEVFYDIITYLMVPGAGRSLKILINLEAQKTSTPGYDLVTRSIYYGARRISAQKGVEFSGRDYNNLKKSYSIWICFNVGRDEQGTITEYAIRKSNLCGRMPDKERYDLMSSVFIRLGGGPDDYKKVSLQDLLMTVFSGWYSVSEIENRLSKEYDFKFDKGLKEEVSEMCNLSYGVEERGIQKGIEQGRAEEKASNARKLAVILNTTYEKALDMLENTDERPVDM